MRLSKEEILWEVWAGYGEALMPKCDVRGHCNPFAFLSHG